MTRNLISKRFSLFFFIGCAAMSFSQPDLNYRITTDVEKCQKGGAVLHVPVPGQADSVFTTWSTGEKNVFNLTQLSAGDYFVQVKTKYKKDTLYYVKDTLITFTIGKDQCPLLIGKYFSPNDDGYNDHLSIGNIEKYPSFELTIYNKWGQRVHHQKKVYEPWDGKWLGADLPDGTYYYVIFYDEANKTNVVKGDITILR